MRFRDLLTGIVIGAAAGLLLAPENGRRSRALLKDKAVKYTHETGDFVDKKSRHLANKARGYAHEISSAVSSKIGKTKEVVEEEQPSSL